MKIRALSMVVGGLALAHASLQGPIGTNTAHAAAAMIHRDQKLVVMTGIVLTSGFAALLAGVPGLICSAGWYAKAQIDDLEHPLTEAGEPERRCGKTLFRASCCAFVTGTLAIASSIGLAADDSGQSAQETFRELSYEDSVRLGLNHEQWSEYMKNLPILNVIADEIIAATRDLSHEEAATVSHDIWSAYQNQVSPAAWTALEIMVKGDIPEAVIQRSGREEKAKEPAMTVSAVLPEEPGEVPTSKDAWSAMDAMIPHADLFQSSGASGSEDQAKPGQDKMMMCDKHDKVTTSASCQSICTLMDAPSIPVDQSLQAQLTPRESVNHDAKASEAKELSEQLGSGLWISA